MKHAMLLTVLVAFLLFAPNVQASDCGKNCRVAPDSTVLTISARAEHQADPDIAMISAGVETVSNTAEVALRENSAKMNRVVAALEKAGVEKKDIQTSSMSIHPNYARNHDFGPRITGYTARNNLNVVMHDVKNVGKTIDALVSEGVNNFNGPSFSIDDPEEFINIARKKAFAKAQAKAKLYADAAGLKIKKIVSMSENTNSIQPYAERMVMHAAKSMMAMSDAPTPIEAGQVDLSASIHIEYELGK